MPIIPKKVTSVFFTPTRTIVFSFLGIIIVGTFLLMLPISTNNHEMTPFFSCLFTSTSATCVTGLLIYDTGSHWNLFGQIVILTMIQLGGLGFVTLATFFNAFISKKFSLRSMKLASESINYDDFSDVKKLISMVFKISIICELIGAFALMIVFIPKYGLYGVYISVFLAISAFCNAGFDILGFEGETFAGLTNYADNPIVMITIMLLIICGGLGFVVWYDIFNYRKTKRLYLHTKVVLYSSAVLIVIGMVIFLISEWDNPYTLLDMTIGEKLLQSLFQSITFRTAGFNTIDLTFMNDGTKLFVMPLMLVGAAPGSTSGGIKITTIVVIIMTVISVLRSYPDTIIMHRKVEKGVVYKSLTIVVMFASIIVITSLILGFENRNQISSIDAMFEAVSALSTTGISAGVTAIANTPSKIALMITMFLGRVGPISLGLSITAGMETHKKSEVIPTGRIIVG